MRPINFSLRQLDGFRAVARYLSFSLAARSLFISQPSLTLMIRNLEEALDVQLFERTTRRVELTLAAVELLPVVERTFAELGAVRDKLQGLGGVDPGRVVLGALPSISGELVPRAIHALRQRFPEVSVVVYDDVAQSLMEMVRSGKVDFAVGTAVTVDPDVIFTPVTSDAMLFICSTSHRLARRKQVAWSDIVDEPFIAMTPGTSVRHATDMAFTKLRMVRAMRYEVSTLSTMFGLARAGAGVTALPETVFDVFKVAGIARIPLVSPVVRRDIGFLTHSGRAPTTAAAELMRSISHELLKKKRRTERKSTRR